MSNSLRPCGLWPTGHLCPWNFLGKNTEVGCRFLLQGIFLIQGSNSSTSLASPALVHVKVKGALLLLSRFSRVRLCETP